MSQEVKEYISVKEAREQLTDKMFWAFCKWLRDQGYDNLTKIGEDQYKSEIFATKDQLNRFLNEHGKSSDGSTTLKSLFGQTREFLQSGGRKKK